MKKCANCGRTGCLAPNSNPGRGTPPSWEIECLQRQVDTLKDEVAELRECLQRQVDALKDDVTELRAMHAEALRRIEALERKP